MKTLLLLRHGKSNWNDPSLADHDRPLKKRGVKAAKLIGSILRNAGLQPDMVVCSTAVRARDTFELVLPELKFKPKVELVERLYHCAPSEFGDVLREFGPNVATGMLVGHNPGMEEFLTLLAGKPETFPTAALAQVELELDDWSAFSDATAARVVKIWRPKEIEAD